jgi:hypothetical protein
MERYNIMSCVRAAEVEECPERSLKAIVQR